MPEGDSYTRAADRVRPLLVDQAIEAIDGAPAVRKYRPRLLGSTVTGVRTKGKHLLIDTTAGLTIHVALGMPGRVRARSGSGPNQGLIRRGPTRLAMATNRGVVTVDSAPTVEVERTRVIDASLDRLGPDVLAPEFDWETYRERAARAPDDMLVCDFLLDQRVLAGVGNEYKNEILFLEKLHPRTPIGMLDPKQRDRLADRARGLMMPNAHRSFRTTTGRYAPGTDAWVYGRGGKPCRRCRDEIVEASVGRSHPRITYWCPSCQRIPGVSRQAT